MRNFSIDIEYINGTILQKPLFGIQGNLSMVVWLNMKMVNPLQSEFDIQINFMRVYVDVERPIVKMNFVKNSDWDHFVSKSQLK